MRRGIETAMVLVIAFAVLPFAALTSMSTATVPPGLWVALVSACLSYVPARAWAVRR